jgi:hypothetical protein
MIANTNQWSHPRDNPVVPSHWQATISCLNLNPTNPQGASTISTPVEDPG